MNNAKVARLCEHIIKQVTTKDYLSCLKMKRLQLEMQNHRNLKLNDEIMIHVGKEFDVLIWF